MERRNFLRASIATAGGVAAAGCADRLGIGDDDGDGAGDGAGAPEFPVYDLPAYAAWPPAEPRTDDHVLFGHLNVHHLQEAEADEGAGEEEIAEDDDDLLLALPGYGFMLTSLWFYLGTWGYPWDGTLGTREEPDGLATEALTMTEGTLVFHGEYDATVFADEYAAGFEERDADGFTVFEGRAEENADGLAYAVSEDAVVVALSSAEVDGHEEVVANLEAAIDNRLDEVGRVVDDEDGEWLFETTGAADMVTGFWRVDGLAEEDLQPDDDGDDGADDEGDDGADEGAEQPEDDGTGGDAPDVGDDPVFDDVDSFVSALVLPEADGGVGGDTTAVRFSALYPEGAVPSEDELREQLLDDDTDAELEVTTADDRVHVSASVSDDEVDEPG